MGNGAATAAARGGCAVEGEGRKGRAPPRFARPAEPKVRPEAIPLPTDVLPVIFSYASSREVGVFLWVVSRGATAQLRATWSCRA